jgi:uncharacterized ferritin-like protein (DUF455 family)
LDIFQQAQSIVEGSRLENKLIPLKFTMAGSPSALTLVTNPGRESKIAFSDKQLKFPNKNKLVTVEGTAIALHFFANHELLAIEMMAMAILKFPVKGEEGDKFRKTLISTIKDEQKHFKLYQTRMSELGVEFGDLPVNDFFWKQIHHCTSIESFYAMMALTFESANLDFANYYKNIFVECEDFATADILSTVLEDEIRHVKIGWNYVSQSNLNTNKNEKIWNYYLSLLPSKITPARAKGINYNPRLREQAGIDKEFVNQLSNFKSEFNITNRKIRNSK